jgi:hypothetical protein
MTDRGELDENTELCVQSARAWHGSLSEPCTQKKTTYRCLTRLLLFISVIPLHRDQHPPTASLKQAQNPNVSNDNGEPLFSSLETRLFV